MDTEQQAHVNLIAALNDAFHQGVAGWIVIDCQRATSLEKTTNEY